MIGYEELLQTRLAGYKPSVIVWIRVFDVDPSPYDKRAAKESIANGFCPEVLIMPNDSISALDLIGLRGLTIHIDGKNDPRCREVVKACRRHSATVVWSLGSFLSNQRDLYANQT